MTNLMLGTAQFGMTYGLTNKVGRIDDSDLQKLLAEAIAGGVSGFDTAADYGDAEARLGRLIGDPEAMRVTSKFRLPADGTEPTRAGLIDASLELLRSPTLHGLLLHRVDDLDDPRMQTAIGILREARSEGLVQHVGVSIYDGDDLRLAVSRWPDLDMLQIPGSIVDQRLLADPLLRSLHEAGTEIHVRSAYLQGVLLADVHHLPARFSAIAPAIEALQELADRVGASRAAIALAFLRHNPIVDAVVVGVTTSSELHVLLADWTMSSAAGSPPPIAAPLQLLDPRRW